MATASGQYRINLAHGFGFCLRLCQHPRDHKGEVSKCDGCGHKAGGGCAELAYFPFLKHGWQGSLDLCAAELRRRNPRGRLATGRGRVPTAPLLPKEEAKGKGKK